MISMPQERRGNKEKATGSIFNPCVNISVEIVDNQVAIKVKDNGTGM